MSWPRKPSSATGRQVREEVTVIMRGGWARHGGREVTRAVCIRDISPAVKVNARQRREKEIGVGDTGTHTMLQSKATLLTAPLRRDQRELGETREGTVREREREKKRRHHRGSVRVQKTHGHGGRRADLAATFFSLFFFFAFALKFYCLLMVWDRVYVNDALGVSLHGVLIV